MTPELFMNQQGGFELCSEMGGAIPKWLFFFFRFLPFGDLKAIATRVVSHWFIIDLPHQHPGSTSTELNHHYVMGDLNGSENVESA